MVNEFFEVNFGKKESLQSFYDACPLTYWTVLKPELVRKFPRVAKKVLNNTLASILFDHK